MYVPPHAVLRLVVVLLPLLVPVGERQRPRRPQHESSSSSHPADEKPVVITITVVYDNNPGADGLVSDWGFACLVQGFEQTVLFDTGASGDKLLANMRALGLDPHAIDAVVISHRHGDHTGGLEAVLRGHTGIPVYVPAAFPAKISEHVRSLGADVNECSDSRKICDGLVTTGTLGQGAIEEHALCVRTSQGWVLITGCAHPGVDQIAQQASSLLGDSLDLIVGGFHLPPKASSELGTAMARSRIKLVIDGLERLNVRRVAPCHCSGDLARQMFKERFGERCNLIGVGHVFKLSAAKR